MAKINVKVDVGQEGQSRFVNKTIDVPDNYRFLNSHAIDQNQFEQLQKMPENMRGMAMVGQRSIQNPSGTMQSAATDYQFALRAEGVKPQDFASSSAQEYHKRKASSNFGKFMPLRPAFHQAEIAAKNLEQSGQAEMFGAGAGAIPFGLGGVAALGFGKLTQLGIGAASHQLTRMGVGELTKKIVGYGLGSIALGHYGYETYKHGGPLSGLRQGNLNFASGFEAISDLTLTKDLFKGAAGIAKGFMGGKGPDKLPSVGANGSEGFSLQRWVNSATKNLRNFDPSNPQSFNPKKSIPGFKPEVVPGKDPNATAYVKVPSAKTGKGGNIGKIYEGVFGKSTPTTAWHEIMHLFQGAEDVMMGAFGGDRFKNVRNSANQLTKLFPEILQKITGNKAYANMHPENLLKEVEAFAGGFFKGGARTTKEGMKLNPVEQIIKNKLGVDPKTAEQFASWGQSRIQQFKNQQRSIGMGYLKGYSKDELRIAKSQLEKTIAHGEERGVNVDMWKNRLKEIENFQSTGEIPKNEGPRRVRGIERREPPFGGAGGEGGGGTAVLDAPPKVDTTVKPPITQKPQTQTKPKTETKPQTETEAPVKPEIEAPPVAPETPPKAPEKPIEAPQQPKPNVVPKPPQEVPTKPKPIDEVKPKAEPEVKPKEEAKPNAEPEGEIKPKDEAKAKPEVKPGVEKVPEKVPEKIPAKPIAPPKVLPPPVGNRFEDIQQIEYGFYEMGGYWLPAAPSFHAGQWATPAYIINSGRLEYNVDE